MIGPALIFLYAVCTINVTTHSDSTQQHYTNHSFKHYDAAATVAAATVVVVVIAVVLCKVWLRNTVCVFAVYVLM